MRDDVDLADTLDCMVPCANMLGESPIWIASEQALYWVDIRAPAIFRFQPANGLVQHWTPPFRITSIVPCVSGGLAGASDAGLLTFDLEANRYDVFGNPEHGQTSNRFNDGAVDHKGRYWIGSMDDAECAATGHVYRVFAKNGWVSVDHGFHVPNGPAFSPDGQWAYLADSPARVIYRYQLELDGNPLARQDFLRFDVGQGYPDGMTTDANGCLWVCFWDGRCVRCFNPDGALLREIALPISRPTSCCFGGEALDQLFITSARTGLDARQLDAEPTAGGLFRLSSGVHGWPLPKFAD